MGHRSMDTIHLLTPNPNWPAPRCIIVHKTKPLVLVGVKDEVATSVTIVIITRKICRLTNAKHPY